MGWYCGCSRGRGGGMGGRRGIFGKERGKSGREVGITWGGSNSGFLQLKVRILHPPPSPPGQFFFIPFPIPSYLYILP